MSYISFDFDENISFTGLLHDMIMAPNKQENIFRETLIWRGAIVEWLEMLPYGAECGHPIIQ